MTIQELKEKVIESGIASVKKYEKGEQREGAIEGFELCRELNTPQECEKELKERRKKEIFDEDLRSDTKKYWRYRYATLQIEYWYEILKVAFCYPTISARAGIRYSQIVGVKKSEKK